MMSRLGTNRIWYSTSWRKGKIFFPGNFRVEEIDRLCLEIDYTAPTCVSPLTHLFLRSKQRWTWCLFTRSILPYPANCTRFYELSALTRILRQRTGISHGRLIEDGCILSQPHGTFDKHLSFLLGRWPKYGIYTYPSMVLRRSTKRLCIFSRDDMLVFSWYDSDSHLVDDIGEKRLQLNAHNNLKTGQLPMDDPIAY